MTARNKWLLAQPDSSEAKTGAHIGLTGSDVLIYRLLFNLTENAVKYNRLGGSVRVELARWQETVSYTHLS